MSTPTPSSFDGQNPSEDSSAPASTKTQRPSSSLQPSASTKKFQARSNDSNASPTSISGVAGKIRLAATENNCNIINGGVGLSEKSQRLLMRSERLREWKDLAKQRAEERRRYPNANSNELEGDGSELGKTLPPSALRQRTEPTSQPPIDDESSLFTETRRSKSALLMRSKTGVFTKGPASDSGAEPMRRSSSEGSFIDRWKPKRNLSTLASRVFSWPVVLDRVIAKKRSSEAVQTKRNSRPPSVRNTGRAASEGPDDFEDEELNDLLEEEEEEPEFSVRREILRFILSWKFEVFLLILLAADVILLIVELELQTRVVCHITWDRRVSQVTVPSGHPFLSSPTTVNCSDAADIEYTCDNTRSFTLPQEYAVCPFYVKEELPHSIHTAELIINGFSRAIIGTFGLEILTIIICSGFSILWRHKMYLLDFIVIFVSIVLDIFASVYHFDRASELIVIARIWRFARIVHGVGTSVHDVDEHELEDEEEAEEEREELLEVYFPGSSPRLREKRKQLEEEQKEKDKEIKAVDAAIEVNEEARKKAQQEQKEEDKKDEKKKEQ